MIDPQLRNKLLRMIKKDQAASQASKEDFTKISKQNTEELKQIIDENGWPTIPTVGKNGTEAAWIIAQHADHDLAFQKKCLALITKEVKIGNVPKHHLAYLQDRILINEDKPQKFGTQIKTVDQKRMPYPIQNTAELDKLRMEYGLPPLKLYLQIMNNFQKTQHSPKKN